MRDRVFWLISSLAMAVGGYSTDLAAQTRHVATFHDAVAAAWAQLPQRQDLAARGNVAAARFTAGGALFPNAPSLTGSYINDRILGSNQNYITSQAELATPIWLPGEGTATQKAAQAEGGAVAADEDATHLALAGQVLDLVVQAARASGRQEAAEKRAATARALAADVHRRLAVGEAPQSDALAADAEADSAQATLDNAQAELEQGRASLSSITGEENMPELAGSVPLAARPLPAAALLAGHPRILAAERALSAAQASARLAGIQNRDDPELGLQSINEKQPGQRWDTRFGVTLRFSFATAGRNAPLRAAAEQSVTRAMVQLELARREVVTAIRISRAALLSAEQVLPSTKRQAAALDQRRGQIERAWRLGEMSLVEVVRAQALASDADLARATAAVDVAAARERVLLAEGKLP